METKYCSRCREDKPVEDFGPSKQTIDGRFAYCRRCNNAYQKVRIQRPDQIERRRAYHLRRNFGITSEEYGTRWVAQNGVCAIHRGPETTLLHGKVKPLAVDHDHNNLSIRGLLCSDCNRGIGCFGDSIDYLLRAALYLADHHGLVTLTETLKCLLEEPSE